MLITVIVLILFIFAVTAGCVKALSKSEDLRLWEEKCKRRKADEKRNIRTTGTNKREEINTKHKRLYEFLVRSIGKS